MEKCYSTREKSEKIWISITGYRVLLILRALMEKSCSVVDLLEIVQKNIPDDKTISKDTIRVDLNTLKNAGCKISRPSKSNDYKYELLSHPFILELSEKELNTLLRLRDKVAYDMDWKETLILNEIYSKIISLTFNEEQKELVEVSKPLFGIQEDILNQITNPSFIGKKVEIVYNSPKFGEEILHVIPRKITYETGRMHLWCYSFKYKMNSILNAERILKIISVNISEKIDVSSVYDVEYIVLGNSVKMFEKEEFEEILEKNEDSIRVLAHVENEFYFIQRILLFGCDFRIISPEFFKEKLINKIKLIQKGYQQ